MEFQVLGPLRVMHDEVPVYVATAHKPQLLLAMLCAYPGQVLTVEKLIHELWGEKPPSSARQNLHQYLHRLRLALGPSLLPNLPAGYSLSADASIDSTKFLSLVRAGTAAFEEGDFDQAALALWDGLQLWRGDAFADLSDSELIATAALALEQQRITATEHWADAKIRIGQAKDVVPVLTSSVNQNPLNENLRVQLMRALAVTGRQAEALELFRDTRALLIEQLGIEPGAALTAAHQAILRGDVLISPVPQPLAAPRELPANVSGFVGRAEALAELDAMLPSNQDDPAGPVIISAIAGTAGVGKTALAIRWSHRVSSQFPDGQLHLNLNGYSTADPMTPMAALSSLLGSLGTKPNEVPADLHSAAARYRTLLSGRRMLILLDNARSAEQVRPLLPGSPGCLVVVTSRDRLNGLVAQEGASRLNLDTLSPPEAVALLEHLLGTQRVSAEPQAVQDLVKLCAYLPLALRIAAARLADQPHLTVAAYVEALQTKNPAVALATDEAAVHKAFQLSYVALTPAAQRIFRRLGLLPLQSFTAGAIAQLADVSEPAAEELLEQLAAAHLVTQEQSGRFSVHDLLRHYANLVMAAEDSQATQTAAIERLYQWYLAKIHAAGDQVHPHIVRLPLLSGSLEQFDGLQAALSWLDIERKNFRVLIDHAMRHGPMPMVWLMADGLRGYYEQIRHTVERLNIARMAVAAARIVGDNLGLAAALLSLAHACFGAGRHHSCIRYLELAATNARLAGWRHGEAAIRGNLGSVLAVLGQAAAAVASAKASIEIYRSVGYLLGEAKSRDSLANCCRIFGLLEDGVREANGALAQFTELGSRQGIGMANECLGELQLDLGQLDIALMHTKQALEIQTELHAPFRVAVNRLNLAKIHIELGNLLIAEEASTIARASLEELRDLRLGAKAANLMGELAVARGNYEAARAYHQEALHKASVTEASSQIAEAHLGLAAVYLVVGDTESALDNAMQSLRLSRDSGYRVTEGQALNMCAAAHLKLENTKPAHDFAARALALNRETGHMPGEVRSRDLIARCELALAVVGELESDA